MSTLEPNDTRRVLYLDRIEVETVSRRGFRVKLRTGSNDAVIQQEKGSSTWIPARSLELEFETKITMIIKVGHGIGGVSWRAQEVQAELNGQDALDAFWGSIDSISREVRFDQQPATITFKFRPSPTSETTRKVVQGLESAMGNYRVLMSDTTENKIDLVFKYGAKIAEINPIVSAVFNIASNAFEVLKEQKKYDGMVSELAEWIARILPFATLLLEEIVCDETELLDQAVRKMCTLVVDTANFICNYTRQNPAARAVKGVATDAHAKITAFQGDFVKLKEDFDRAVNVETLKSVRKTEEFRLLDRLKPADAAGYQEDRTCMKGTRTAVLDEVIAWALDLNAPPIRSNAENIYWLYGSPGLGKTSVASSLCERLHRSRNLGGSFFCRRDDPILRQPRRVLPSLISKLAEMWSPYRRLVAQALQDDPQLNPDSARGEVLLKLLQSVQRHPPSTLVLVIDALDECSEPSTRKPLLKSLSDACFQVPWLKIIVTSRPEYDIETFFKTRLVTSRNLAIDDPMRKDIALFARNSMASVAERRHLGDWPNEERLAQIVERSGGLFIFVETLRRFVDKIDPKPLLAQVLDGDLKDANAELYALYSTTIITRIGPHMNTFRSIAQAIVVVSKYRPLCDETLASLLMLEQSVVRTLIDELSPLLYRDRDEKDGIRVRHLSVTEFLTGPVCPSEFRVDLQQANAELSLRCLATMMKELKFNICKLETSYLTNAEMDSLDKLVDLSIPDGLQYSCMHWSSHLCSVSDSAIVEVSALLDEFFTGPRPLYWIEVLSLMGKVPIAISDLRQIKASIQFRDRHHEPVNDVLRFLQAFRTPILTSTPHIYISALPFTPEESWLWKNANESFPKVMDVCKGRIKSWPTLPGVWQGHASGVSSIASSQDGRYVVSGSHDNTIRMWDAETGEAVGEPWRGHTGWINSVAYSPDGRRVVSGSVDMTIRIWDAETGEAVGEPVRGHTSSIFSVAYSPDGRRVVSASGDKTIQFWDAETGEAVGESLRGHRGWIHSVAYSPDGRRVVSGSEDNTVRMWDAETGEAVGETWRGHTGWINSVAYSPDGRRVVSGSVDMTIRMWDAETGEAVGEPWRGHTGEVYSVAYSPGGRRVVSVSRDMTVRIWDAETGEAVGECRGHTNTIISVAYSQDGQYVVSGSHDNTIRIWDADAGEAMGEPLVGHTGMVLSVAYSPDGRHIVSGSNDETIQFWDAETGEAVGEPLRGHRDWIHSVAYSPDGRRVVSVSSDKTIRFWDAEIGEVVGEPWKGHTDEIICVAYSPDGRRLVTASGDNTIRMRDAESGEAVGEPWKGHTDEIICVAYSPDGRRVVSASGDKTIRFWDAETGEAVGELIGGHTDGINMVAYSPDSRRVVTASADNTIRIWDAETGEAVGGSLKGHTDWIRGVAYSPDGRRVVSASSDKTIRFWDAETGETVGNPVRGHTDGISSVAYSPDGRYVVSGSEDMTIRIWDAETGEPIGAPLTGNPLPVYTFAYPRGGQNIVSGFSDKTVRVWDAEAELKDGGQEATSDSSNAPNSDAVITNSLSNNRAFLSALSNNSIPPDMLGSDGYVRSTEGLLFWVPEDCRDGITCSAIMTLPTTGRHRLIRVDFTNLQYGNSWTNVYAGM